MNPCQRDQSPQYVSLMSGVCRPLEGSAGCTCTTSSPTQCKERVIVGMQAHPINPLHTLVDNTTMACQISHVGMSGCAVVRPCHMIPLHLPPSQGLKLCEVT